MFKHPNLTEQRIKNFLRDPWSLWYEERAPLSAIFTHDLEPIPFSSLPEREWKAIRVGERWGGNWESAWFRFSGEIPISWEGRGEVFFLIDTGSEACVFSEDGEPLCGLTSSEGRRDPTWRKGLFPANGKPGERVELLVEAAANLMFGHVSDCHLREASLVLLRRDRWELWHDMQFLMDLHDSLPNDHPRRAQILYALNEALNLYGSGSPEEVRRCRDVLREQLQRPANASAHKVSAIGHAHIDVAWLWPLRETIRKACRTFSTALKLMEEYPEYKFGASQPQLYEFVKIHYPGLYERIKEAVKAGRWEVQGGMWVEADTNISGGEALVRQILFGKRFFLEEFGIEVENLWLPDVFGYTASLPQILALSGIKYFMTQKISWNQFNKFPYHTFLWEGIDGTRVFAHFPPADTYNGDCRPRELLYASRNFSEKDRTDRWLYLFGIGDGGGGPSRHHIEFARRARDCEELPKVTMEFASEFFKKASDSIKDIPIWRGELYLELHRGTLTTQARNKRMNRISEILLRDAEILSSIDPLSYPRDEINSLWKIVLMNQFHDILPGSSITWVYRDSQRQYAELIPKAEGIISRALSKLEGMVETRGEGRPLLVVNTLSWDREGVVEVRLKDDEEDVAIIDSSGEELLTQEVVEGGVRKAMAKVRVPSMGYSVFFVRSGRKRPWGSELSVSESSLENELIRVEFDNNGYISRIYDKQERREVIAEGGRGNLFGLYEDIPAAWDAWDVDIYYEEKPPVIPDLVESRVRGSGPLFASLMQERRVSNSTISQEIRIFSGSKRIEFITKVSWNESRKMLRVSFPVDIHSDIASFEIQFGHIRRPTHRNTSWEMAKFEVAAHKWVDISEPNYGVALLNDCKYGHKVYGNVIDLNLLRSPKEPDPEADIGDHFFTYALLPHSGDLYRSGVIREGYELNIPMRVFEATPHPGRLPMAGSALKLSKGNVIVEALKMAEDEDALVIRIYEAYGQRTELSIEFPFSPKRVFVADLLEREKEEIKVCDRTIYLDLRPFEIQTLKIFLPVQKI
jgi:alpha-mannosidase